jgi:hypothetical protein
MTVAGDIDAIERRLSGASPVLGVLSRVKNECDIIEAFVRHHAGLVDRIIVVDNGSQDGTSEILAALVEEGLPLAVLADPTLEYRQAEIMTYLTRAGIRGFELDRLFLLDADEFLHVGSRGAVEGALAGFHSGQHLRMAWSTFVPESGPAADGLAPATIRRRRREMVDPHYKLAISKAFLDQPGATIAMGNHAVLEGGVERDSPIAQALRIAHYPVRSIDQLQTKAALGWTAYVAMGYEGGGLGDHWRQFSEAFDRGEPIALRDIAFGYPYGPQPFLDDDLIEDPVPFVHELRYLELAKPKPSRTIARFSVQVARRYAELQAEVGAMRSELGALETRIAGIETST